MNTILENIARENFRSSGYISHPTSERRVPWTFSAPPRSPFFATDTVRDAMQRRERAQRRENEKPSRIQTWFHVLLNR
ncbi:MAG: hypothetical protein ACPG3X_05740 [Opitutales bacterium]